MFYGREEEQAILKTQFTKKKSTLGCFYGRRRVGKSELLKHFGKNKNFLYFDGLEGASTKDQIKRFVQQLIQQTEDIELVKLDLSSWDKVFNYLTEYFEKQKKKTFIVFDEFQWMAAGQQKLVSLIKAYWDEFWLNQNVMLILCGSIASFMINKVIKSKSLYGRIDFEILVRPLKVAEAKNFFKHSSHIEMIQYFSALGTIPKYLDYIDPKKSFDQNIIELFFQPNSIMLNEIDKIFYGHFKEPAGYKKIIYALAKKGPINSEEIARILKVKSGGGSKSYIENLIDANFISPVKNFALKSKKGQTYRLTDPYLRFYFSFIYPNLASIKGNRGEAVYNSTIKKNLGSWLGVEFEVFCHHHVDEILKCNKLNSEILEVGEYYKVKNKFSPGVQVDMVWKHTDGSISAIEIKSSSTIYPKYVDKEIEQKIKAMLMQFDCSIRPVQLLLDDKNKKSDYSKIIGIKSIF